MTKARLLPMPLLPLLAGLVIPILFGAGCAHRPVEVSEKALEREFRRLSLAEKRRNKPKANAQTSPRTKTPAAPFTPRVAIGAQDLATKGPDLFGPWMLMESTTPVGESVNESVVNSAMNSAGISSDALRSKNIASQTGTRGVASFSSSTNAGFRTMKPEALTENPGHIETGKISGEKVESANTAAPGNKKTRQKVDEAHLIFDFPVTYNARVRKWIRYFQTTGRPSFRRWLERSTRYIPYIQTELKRAGLPTDIAYVAMIESGFSSSAVSHAHAMGMWQFIAPTGKRYGLGIDWWIDERRDYEKATRAAIGYMSDLFEQFGSWYLVAASYNMGEGGVRRLIKRHGTNSFWDLADRGALPEETRNYVPKMLAAMLIAKAPALYGFRDLDFQLPFSFEFFDAPGGTDLIALASHLGVSERSLTELNPELLKGFIPREIKSHRIRIPKGSRNAVAQFLNVRTI